MRRARPWLSFLVVVGPSGCLKKDPLYCDENTPCTDPDHAVRCWGNNDFGQLGTGDRESIGDMESGSDADPVRVLE